MLPWELPPEGLGSYKVAQGEDWIHGGTPLPRHLPLVYIYEYQRWGSFQDTQHQPRESLEYHSKGKALPSLCLEQGESEGQFALLEKGPCEPVGKGLKKRFSNRFPQTETNGLGLGYRVFHPVPQATFGTGWKLASCHRGCHADASWQPLWYRLAFPTGTNVFCLI